MASVSRERCSGTLRTKARAEKGRRSAGSGCRARRLGRVGDGPGDERGAEVVEVVAVVVERAVADVVDAAAGEVLVAEDVRRADAEQVRALDRVEGGEDRGLAA